MIGLNKHVLQQPEGWCKSLVITYRKARPTTLPLSELVTFTPYAGTRATLSAMLVSSGQGGHTNHLVTWTPVKVAFLLFKVSISQAGCESTSAGGRSLECLSWSAQPQRVPRISSMRP